MAQNRRPQPTLQSLFGRVANTVRATERILENNDVRNMYTDIFYIDTRPPIDIYIPGM